MTTPSAPATAAEFRAIQTKEYGTYVAVEKIRIDGALAFKPGDPVPAGHVSSGIVGTAQVAKVGTKSAESVNNTEKG